jgi:hypothetical protein
MDVNFWEFFLAIEGDLTKTTRFVEFNEENFKTYSVEFARILLSASSEVEVLFKELCSIIKHNESPEKIKNMNMKSLQEIITTKYPKFYTIEVLIPQYDIVRKPWKEWAPNSDRIPQWWNSYNNVKHYRGEHYSEANLENAIDSVAALFAVVLYFLREKDNKDFPTPFPKILELKKSPGYLADHGYGLPDFP